MFQSPEAARKDWRAELDTQGQRIYDEFRLWRSRKAKHDGLPPYLILNNHELAELVMEGERGSAAAACRPRR